MHVESELTYGDTILTMGEVDLIHEALQREGLEVVGFEPEATETVFGNVTARDPSTGATFLFSIDMKNFNIVDPENDITLEEVGGHGSGYLED